MKPITAATAPKVQEAAKSSKKVAFERVSLSHIVADPNQPRKYFNAEKLKTLIESIRKYGIMNPLIVEEIGKDKYLLTDGERRFRAAQELKLKEVPVIIEAPQGETERMVRQFNIQEQHEAWTPVEKAIAITNLSKQLGLTLPATCKLLNVAGSDTRKYVAFAQLADKDKWIRSEAPLDYVVPMTSLSNTAKHLTEIELEEEWTLSTQKALETKVVSLIKEGIIIRRGDIVRLKDAFTKQPKSIQKFLTNKDSTPTSLFAETKAKGAYHLRNAMHNSTYIVGHIHRFLENKDMRISDEQVAQLKVAKRAIEDLIAQGV